MVHGRKLPLETEEKFLLMITSKCLWKNKLKILHFVDRASRYKFYILLTVHLFTNYIFS